MLEHTFVHIPGIGSRTERALWEQGVLTWTDALDTARPTGFSDDRWSRTCRCIEQSARNLERLEHRYFADGLSPSEHWRAWRNFAHAIAYLDIETTGCAGSDRVTVVGIYDGSRTSTFVRGDNLDDLRDVLDEYAMIVTFNGASFDLPFLRRHFRGLQFHHLHLDLMHVLRRIGYTGGLKSIERQVGIERDDDLAGLSGWDAVRLWNDYCRGSDDALDTLVRYNAADIENLEILSELAFSEMKSAIDLPRKAQAGGEVGQ
jgi:hypothetical protein